MHTLEADDLDKLMSKTFRYQFFNPTVEDSSAIETSLYDVQLFTPSMAYTLDIGTDMCFTKLRWSMLTKMYLNAGSVNRFIEGAKVILAGDARNGASVSMVCRDVPESKSNRQKRWGNCLLGLSFSLRGDKGQLTMNSRATYNGHMSFLDAAIGHVIAREISDGHPENIQFLWNVDTLNVPGLKTIPYVCSHPNLHKALLKSRKANKHTPTMKLIDSWLVRVEKAYKELGAEGMIEAEKYGPLRRSKERWLELVGPLKHKRRPSVPLTKLDLSSCYVES